MDTPNNIYSNIPDNFDKEIFEKILSNDNVCIHRILSKGHSSPDSGWYDQEQNEWVMVVRGEAILEFENGESVRLKNGDYINILAHQKHKVQWTDPKSETIWLSVFY